MRRKLKNLISACLQKCGALARDPQMHEELRNTIQKGQRALELQLLQKNQSEIDRNQAEAAAVLLSSIPADSEAVLRIGSILIVKHLRRNGKPRILVRTLTQRELIAFEKNSALVSDPRIILELLARDGAGDDQAGTDDTHLLC